MRQEPMDPHEALIVLTKAVQPRLKQISDQANMHDMLSATDSRSTAASRERKSILEALDIFRELIGGT